MEDMGITGYEVSFTINEEEQEMVKDMFLLTSKPIIYISNISE